MRDADVAMYRAKADGKGRHAVFDAAMHEQVMRRLDMEGELRARDRGRRARGRLPADRAGRDGPHRRLRGARAAGPTRRARPSSCAIAEETGLIVPLGRQVLRAACAQLARVARAAARRRADDRRQRLAPPARRAGLRARCCADRCSTSRARPARAAARGLRARPRARPRRRRHAPRARAGARAGSACARTSTTSAPARRSLRLLHRFPGDAIKISRALVTGIGHDAGAFEIVRAVVGLAHNLGLEVIAEGVEKREQLDYLKVLGCEFAQGFHISAPLTRRGGAGAAGDSALGRALAARRLVGPLALASSRSRGRSGSLVARRRRRVLARRRRSARAIGRRRRRPRAVVDAASVAGRRDTADVPAKRSRSESSISSWSAMPRSCRPARSWWSSACGALGLGLALRRSARAARPRRPGARGVGLGTVLAGDALAPLLELALALLDLALARACAAARRRAER